MAIGENILSQLTKMRANLLETMTVAYMGLKWAQESQIQAWENDEQEDDPQIYLCAQLAYERARGQLDAITDAAYGFFGSSETSTLLREAARAVGYEPHKANEFSVHAAAPLATHAPSKQSWGTPTTTHVAPTRVHPQGTSAQSLVHSPASQQTLLDAHDLAMMHAASEDTESLVDRYMAQEATQYSPENTEEEQREDDWSLYEYMGYSSHCIDLINGSRKMFQLEATTEDAMLRWHHETHPEEHAILVQAGDIRPPYDI